MWPWGHLAVGYLLYSPFCRWRYGRPPGNGEVILLAFGTQLPDLVDKPFAWTFGVLPNGRSVAHSVFTATALITVAVIIFRYINMPTLGESFGVGYSSHLLGDGIPALLRSPERLAFLLWPLLPPVKYNTPQTFGAHLENLEMTPFLKLQILIGVITLAVWALDGLPGIRGLGTK